MSFEAESQGRISESESILEHDDEMSDGITNMDITIIEDGDAINYNGMDEELSEDFNVAATLTLKKNLNEAFEKHAEEVKKTGVKAKIQAFEQVNKKQKFGSARKLIKNVKVRFEAPSSKPPIVPVTRASAKNSSDDCLLSVYLRVRPPTAPKEALEKGQDDCHNTVEIIAANADVIENESGLQEVVDTRIRTYPPVQSNTSKSNRSHNQLYSSSSANGDQKAFECAVKGVKEFEFSQVFGPESSQEELYKSTAVPLVEGLFPKPSDKFIAGDRIVGHSALLFSYGITNAGKTFTMMGKDSKRSSSSDKGSAKIEKFHGIIPRAINHMLDKVNEMNSQTKINYSLNMSYLEIYNEDIYDLLPQKTSTGGSKYGSLGAFEIENKLQLRDLRNGNIHVKGLAKHRVTTLAQGLDLALAAKKKRHTSSNNINADSSRSHSICQFELHATRDTCSTNDENASIATDEASGYGTDDDSVMSTGSKPKSVRFWVVDLAGSERSKRTGAYCRSTRQKEASLINSSLMNLMTCLRALRKNQSTSSSRSMVPFRDSKLTHLFMGHLSGHSASRTRMIVNVNPSIADFDETQHVLSYAIEARSVRIDQNEFTKKMQEIQPVVQAMHTHSANGRPLKSRTRSPPRKIAKLAKKLSPRAALSRRREKKKAAVKTATETVKEKPKARIVGTKRKLEDEMKGLREELDKARLKTSRYQKDANNLQNQLENCETDVREELAEETAAQIKYMREQHEEIVKRLRKQQVQNASQTPSKSAKKAKIDRADQIIEDLMDKIEEGEEEMERMREEHQRDIVQMEQAHAAELEEKEAELEAISTKHARELADREEEMVTLREQLDKDTSLTDNSEDYGDDVSFGDEEEEHEINEMASTPGLKRLPRGRCSEVACANFSPPKENASTSKKSLSLRRRAKKSPFKVLSANKKLSGSTSKKFDDVVIPTSREQDDDGLWKKPRGRAPQGRKWDPEAGGWKLAILA